MKFRWLPLVTAVLRAHSLLAARPGVDRNRIGGTVSPQQEELFPTKL